ncbi:MAG TPA: xanthine dehydrogenase family protein subunit M [Anaerolineales bacterium]|nr:xanthine dehydrogenase family protein subunit M [Anaerolineales bacterium]
MYTPTHTFFRTNLHTDSMFPFNYRTPTSLPEALDLLARENASAHVIAGGTDMVLNMRNGLKAPKTVINLKRLPELKGIAYEEGRGLRIGALTTLREVHRSPLIQMHYPALSHAASRMASEQIRAFATVGGNLCNGSPSADTAPPLIAFDAIVHLVSLAGTRTLPLKDFFTGPGTTALQPGELLQEITVPPPNGKTIFIKHIPRAYMDISVVCVAVRLLMVNGVCQEARIVLGAVAPTPLQARAAEASLSGKRLDADLIEEAAQTAAKESHPIDDAKGSAWYRKQMVGVIVRRALTTFFENV